MDALPCGRRVENVRSVLGLAEASAGESEQSRSEAIPMCPASDQTKVQRPVRARTVRAGDQCGSYQRLQASGKPWEPLPGPNQRIESIRNAHSKLLKRGAPICEWHLLFKGLSCSKFGFPCLNSQVSWLQKHDPGLNNFLPTNGCFPN